MISGRNAISTEKSWNTPLEYVEKVKIFFGGEIDLDPCTNEHSFVSAKTEYILPKDGLVESWDFKRIYINPPYGIDKERKTSIKDWLLRCSQANEDHGSEVVALIPVAPNTKHWQNNIFMFASSICFLKVPRLKFCMLGDGNSKGAPMACCLVYWGERKERFSEVFSGFGKVVNLN
jgi:hypothetical protein